MKSLVFVAIAAVVAVAIGAAVFLNQGTIVSVNPTPSPSQSPPPGVEKGGISLTTTEKNMAMSPGQTRTIKLSLQAVGGFQGDVSFGLRGPIQGAQIKFDPTSTKITKDSDVSVQITISVQSDAKPSDRNMTFTATSKVLSSEVPVGLSIVGSDRVTVEIRNYVYNPASVTVKKGTTITWVNLDDVSHTATADSSAWDSKDIGGQKSFSHAFMDAGAYFYHCTPHPFMLGKVTVIDG